MLALGLNVGHESAYPRAMARNSSGLPILWRAGTPTRLLSQRAGAPARGATASAVAVLLTSGFSVACSGMLAEPAPQVETAALHDAAGDPVIATLHTKNSELRITSSGGHVRYSLLDEEGNSKSLTLEQLQSYDPNLYEFVKNATASSGMFPVLDARVAPGAVAPNRKPSPTTDHVMADRYRPAPPAR
jgi:hypothetical protein